ncbi:hypothetical protein [Streptomyces sp. NBC_00096]|uniref:hypothetical protein n=1 Tax=Streptomyces sp. NBC_00096 TaxID=2975650 RepID=UPI00324520B8
MRVAVVEQDHGVEDGAVAVVVILLAARPVGDREPGRPGLVVAAQAVDHRDGRGGRTERERPCRPACSHASRKRTLLVSTASARTRERVRDQQPGRGVVAHLGQLRPARELAGPPAGRRQLARADGGRGGHGEGVDELVGPGRGARRRGQDADPGAGGGRGREALTGPSSARVQ